MADRTLHYPRWFETLGDIWESQGRYVRRLPPVRVATGEAHHSAFYQLPEPTWRMVAEHFGPPKRRWVLESSGRTEYTPTLDDLREVVQDTIGRYRAQAPDGDRPQPMIRRRLVRRGTAIATAARRLRRALTAARGAVQTVEREYFREQLGETSSGAWVDWDALLPILYAVEFAADDAVAWLPAAPTGAPADWPFKDLVAGLATKYEWWTGKWPRMGKDRNTDRSRDRWTHTGPFADILKAIIDDTRLLRRRRGLGDMAARHLPWVQKVSERQRAAIAERNRRARIS